MIEGFAARYGLAGKLPRHVGIIMDGNGRYAKARGLSRTAGHKAGMERLHGIVKTASDLGIEVLTLYAFSTENWKRPAAEVNGLMELLVEYFKKEIDELNENNVNVRMLGDINGFSPRVRNTIENSLMRTRANTGLKLCLALNYGSRDEILRATVQIASEVKAGVLDINKINADTFSSHLYTAGLPELDLVIRTSGEQRLSNFLLYQCAYAEFIFVKEHWPEFSDELFIDTLREFSSRGRRFGGVV